MELEKKIKLSDKQKRFCEEYVIDWNATRAAKAAGYSDKTAHSIGHENLTKPEINAYIEEIQKDLAKLAGVSALRNILELKKIAYSSIGDFKENWMTEKDFKKLSADVKAALSEIHYVKEGKNKMVRFKLYDKQKAIEGLNKMLGFNEPDKTDITTGGKEIPAFDLSKMSTKDIMKIVKAADEKKNK